MMINFLTGNVNKFKEAVSIVPILEMLDIDLPEVQALDPNLIIYEKLQAAKKAKPNASVLVEDSALFFVEQGKGLLPGPLIKWYQNNFSLEELSSNLNTLKKTKAKAACYLGFYSKDEDKDYFFEGSLLGKIVSPRGENGFGWDVIFQPSNLDITFAELSRVEKLEISHRGRAFQSLKKHLQL